MAAIARDFFERSPLLALPLFAMLLFMSVFVLTAVRALRGHKPTQARLADLPLQEDARHE